MGSKSARIKRDFSCGRHASHPVGTRYAVSAKTANKKKKQKTLPLAQEGQRGGALLATTMRNKHYLRRQCETSIVCDDGSFSSPKECASALSFSSPKECASALSFSSPKECRQACKAGREMETATRNIYLLHRKRSPFSYQREGVLNKRREKVTTVPMVCADTPVRPFYTPKTLEWFSSKKVWVNLEF